MGGKSSTSTSEPWAPAKGALQTTLGDAGKLYQSGVGGSFWTGPTSAPMAKQQMSGLAMMEDNARRMTPFMGQSANKLQAIHSAGPSFAERNLGNVASGKYLSGGDPYFEDVLNTSGRKAMDAVNLQAGMMGRSGSTANMDAIARSIGELQTSARSDQYNRERQNQMAAIDMMDNQRNLGFDRQFSAFDRMPAAFQHAMMPSQALMSVGEKYQGQAQNVLDDQIRMFDAAQSLPWEQLGRYQGIAQGLGMLGGTQTQKQGGGLGNFLGNAIALAGML